MTLRTAQNLGQLLDRAECKSIAGSENESRQDRGAAQLRAEQLQQTRPLQLPRCFLLRPHRRFRQERPDDDERQGRDHARHQHVAPGFVASVDHRERGSQRTCNQDIDGPNHQPSDRGECLGVTQHRLPLLGFAKQFGQPGDRRHELDAHADEHETAQDQQLLKRDGETGTERREGVEQDAEGQDPAPAEDIREIPAQQTKHAADKCGHKEKRPGPTHIQGASRGPRSGGVRRRRAARNRRLNERLAQGGNGGLDDQWQHQEFIDIKGESDGGNDTDQPLS